MYQTPTNVNQLHFASKSTTTATQQVAATNSIGNQSLTNGYINYNSAYTNNNIISNGLTASPNADLNPVQYQPDIGEQYGENDSISLALDEIGAILNSKEFEQPTTNGLYNNCLQQDNNSTTYDETKASIYENLKTIISDDCGPADDTSGSSSPFADRMASKGGNTVRQNKGGTSNANNLKNLFNNVHCDAPVANDDQMDETKRPYVEIVEQPAKCALRFRYKCEGRSAGSLPGVNSTTDNKTFPSIRIHNYVGRAVVVISCVTKDAPYYAHPHNIVGKEGCKKGVCTIVINNEANMVRSFPSLGIQCVKRKDIEESLSLRESINVDPFRNKFLHKSCTSNIDLNVVRLCFQVFIPGAQANKCDVPLVPVVSEPIHDKKAMSDLIITKLSHCSAPATGGREVILLCDRISKDDIQIRFFEERDGKLHWEAFTDLAPTDVHKQVAICFKTPRYYDDKISSPVMARIQLRRLSDNQVSEPRLFQFLPCESDEDVISRKRQKIEWVNMNHYELDNILQPPLHHPHAHPHHHHQHPAHLPHQLQQQHQPLHVQVAQMPRQQLHMPPHRLDNQTSPGQQRSPVMSHQSQPPLQALDQRFNPPPTPLQHFQQHQHHNQPMQQHRQQLQSANSSPSHMSQAQHPTATLMVHRQSVGRRTPTDHSNRGTPSPMQQQNMQHQQQSSPDQLAPPANVHLRLHQQQQQHHMQQQQHQLRQSIDSPEMNVDGDRTPTMQQQQQRQQTGNDNFASAIDNLVVRREIIDNDGKVMRLVDRTDTQSAAGPSTSAQRTDNDKLQNLGNQLQVRQQQVLASSLDRIDTAELMQNIAFSSNIDLNLDMGAENELGQ